MSDEYIKVKRKNKSRRRKANNYYDDEYEDFINCKKHKEELLPRWKLFAVGAAIFMCFALLYPSVFAPMLNSLFGRTNKNEQNSFHQKDSRFYPEGQRGFRPPHAHPAASASMNSNSRTHQNQAVGGNSSRGGFAWLLPFYTIGVVLFLLYTLFKRKKRPKRIDRDLLNLDDEDYSEEESESDEDQQTGKRNRYKLRSVQDRLRKTEKAMQEILNQLELIAINKEEEEKINNNEKDESQNNSIKNKIEKQKTINMEKNLRRLKKLSAIYKKNERMRRCFEDSEDEEGEDEEENKEDDERDDEEEEEGLSSSQEDEEALSELEEDNEDKIDKNEEKQEDKNNNKNEEVNDLRMRRKV